MDIKRGIAVSPGVAIGPALVLDTEGLVIPQRLVPPDQVAAEITQLDAALAQAAAEAEQRKRDIAARLPDDLAEDISAIFGGHALFAQDHRLRSQVENLIRQHCYSAEYAVNRAVADLVQQLGRGGGPFARLAADLRDLEKQLIRILLGGRTTNVPATREPVIVLASDLTPSETAQLDPDNVHAFATESGGPTSHTAILAAGMELPAVVGIGRFLNEIQPGDLVIVDGSEGLLIINPDPGTLARYEALRRAQMTSSVDTEPELLLEPAATRDGTRITLLGNIEFPQEAQLCVDRGAEGVGLYRTEFLYVNRVSDPTEDEHFQAYKAVLASMDGRPVVIRTLDLGADKFSSVSGMLSQEKNPFLGLRSVRLCLRNQDLFKTQLRAILRASAFGEVQVMFPMVSTVIELRQCLHILADVKEDLEELGIPFKRELRVGTMIEVPSAALLADVLAKEVDFFSIGTNDLVQYTLAADRNNENVAGLYNPADPAVLRLIAMVVDAARKEQVEVNVCGEMSGEALYAPLLVGLGVRSFSLTPRKVPEIKRTLRNLTLADAERIARESLRMETAREVTTYLREQQRRVSPESPD
jgi:phosphotransferase system enzyme I (PtsI)